MRFRTIRSIVAVAAALSVIAVPGAGRAAHTTSACQQPFHDPLLCPQPVFEGSSCIAHGVLVVERDLTGSGLIGDAVVDLSRSDAWVGYPAQHEPIDRHPQGGLRPPLPPQIRGFEISDQEPGRDIRTPDPGREFAHGDAQQAGADYSSALVDLSSSTIYSWCDASSPSFSGESFGSWAYGRAGVEDLDLTIGGGALTITSKVLEQELYADGAGPIWDCETVEVTATPPGTGLSICPGPNSDLLGGALSPTVVVEANEQWGPVSNVAGQNVFGGAALHITAQLGLTQIDVYIGYVAVAVMK